MVRAAQSTVERTTPQMSAREVTGGHSEAWPAVSTQFGSQPSQLSRPGRLGERPPNQ